MKTGNIEVCSARKHNHSLLGAAFIWVA